MTKKIFLTSMFALCIAGPAMAAVGDTTFTPNQNVANSCTINVLGESSSTASATAQWSPVSYTCPAGTYLPAGNNWGIDAQYSDNNCARCPDGYYCPGSATSSDATNSKFEYSQTTAKGLVACSTVSSGAYPSSMPGASSANDCYRACTTSDVAHSTGVIGRMYSNNTNMCAATGCSTGYTNTVGTAAPTLPTTESIIYKARSNSNTYLFTLDENGGYEPELADMTSAQLATYNSLSAGEWEITWPGTGVMRGISACNNIAGDSNNDGWDNDASNWSRPANTANMTGGGINCWCMPTTWTPSGGSATPLSATWMYRYDGGGDGPDYCADYCVLDCVNEIMRVGQFWDAMYSTIGAQASTCNANTITINWGDGDDNPNNNPTTQCTYDGALQTPTTAPTKRGHVFTGWTFDLGN